MLLVPTEDAPEPEVLVFPPKFPLLDCALLFGVAVYGWFVEETLVPLEGVSALEVVLVAGLSPPGVLT